MFTIGERLSYCRNVLGLSRPELVSAIKNLSVTTLSRWELNYIDIPILQLERMHKFFNKSGILVSLEWLESGLGSPPINSNLLPAEKYNHDEITYFVYSSLKKNIENIENFIVTNNFLEPFINKGDYVLCVKKKLSLELSSKICYTIDDNGLTVGYLDFRTKSLYNILNQDTTKKITNNFGQVLFISKQMVEYV